MAVLAGAAGPTAIARWATLKAEQLLKVLPLPQRDSSEGCLSACALHAHSRRRFRSVSVSWLQSLRAEAAAATGVQQPILAVDGKTLRRSHDRKNDLGALHSVTVWASDFGLTLAQVATAEKSNEITAIPEVLKLVDLNGSDRHDRRDGDSESDRQADRGEPTRTMSWGSRGTTARCIKRCVDYVAGHMENDFANVRKHAAV